MDAVDCVDCHTDIMCREVVVLVRGIRKLLLLVASERLSICTIMFTELLLLFTSSS